MTRSCWAAAVLGCLLGCSTVPPRIGEAGPTVKDGREESAYEALLAKYTDHEEVYGGGGFDTEILAAVTFQSEPFRVARAQRTASFQAQPAPVLEAQLARERGDFAASNEFWLGTHVTNYRFDDFDRKDSIWRIALITEAGEVTPISVSRVGRADVNMRAYYPYMGDFWVAYRVRFPKTLPDGTPLIGPQTQKLTVRLASTLGKAEFHVAAQ